MSKFLTTVKEDATIVAGTVKESVATIANAAKEGFVYGVENPREAAKTAARKFLRYPVAKPFEIGAFSAKEHPLRWSVIFLTLTGLVAGLDWLLLTYTIPDRSLPLVVRILSGGLAVHNTLAYPSATLGAIKSLKDSVKSPKF